MSKPSALTVVSLLALAFTVTSTVAFFVLDDVRLEPATFASTALPFPPGVEAQAFYASSAESPGRLLVASFGPTLSDAQEEARKAFRAWRKSGYPPFGPEEHAVVQAGRGYAVLMASA